MKTRNRNWSIGLALLMCCVFIIPIIAINENKQSTPITFNGTWGIGDERSIGDKYPISATYDAFNIYIESTSTCSDIIIKVLDNSEFITIEKNVNKEDFPIIIPINYLLKGAYQLVLTNQWGDRLTGEFQID